MGRVYYAKSKLPNGKQPTVAEHLRAVADLAKIYGGAFGQEKEAELCGILHDFGKYSQQFQGVLQGSHEKIDHALGGAALLYGIKNGKKYWPVIEAINGHHDGLLSFEEVFLHLKESLTKSEPVYCNAGKEASLTKDTYGYARQAFQEDFPNYLFPAFRAAPKEDKTAAMLNTRMLFSCLVDADYSASAEEEQEGYLERAELEGFDPGHWLEELLAYREKLRIGSNSDPKLNAIRDELFDCCGEMGEQPGGLFTLTAPTGTGKTLALLHFALRHCIAQGKRRIILVLPFLTLAEQNVAIYEKIVPELLEDHSQKNLPEDAQEYAARWSAPAILTTSVKFFEGLFAQRPTDCRKLHNIANSVVVFDEAQSLNPEVTAATLGAVKALCEHYGCTVVFSTATQPSFGALPGMDWEPKEIMTDHAAMFDALRRTHVEWRLDQPILLEKIAAEMAQQASVCTIVNLRKHARKLYGMLSERCEAGSVFFMTTDLCPEHRSRIVSEIKSRQQKNLPCRVVSTQCIEAGVDLDFVTLYRALAPLDSIIQAAGRCNRNGRNSEGGQVIVFIPDEEGNLYPGIWYENAALLVKRLNMEQEIDIHAPADIERYYQALFSRAKDKKKLREAIEGKDYPAVAREYRLISSQGLNVIVAYAGAEEKFRTVREQALAGGMSHRLMREAAGIVVSVYMKPEELEQWAEPLYLPPRPGTKKTESGYYLLRAQHESLYSDDMGLQFPKIMPENYLV